MYAWLNLVGHWRASFVSSLHYAVVIKKKEYPCNEKAKVQLSILEWSKAAANRIESCRWEARDFIPIFCPTGCKRILASQAATELSPFSELKHTQSSAQGDVESSWWVDLSPMKSVDGP